MGQNQSELEKPSVSLEMMDSVNFKMNQLSDRRKMLKTELGRARAANTPFKSHQVENLQELSVNPRESKNQSLKTYLLQEMAKTQNDQSQINKPTAFVATHPKRLNIGHNP